MSSSDKSILVLTPDENSAESVCFQGKINGVFEGTTECVFDKTQAAMNIQNGAYDGIVAW